MKKPVLIIKIIIFCIVALIGVLLVLVLFPSKTPLKAFIVLSGSMEPNISAGSMIIVEHQARIFSNGDIITFIHPNNPTEYVTHRVIGTKVEGNSLSYLTKGDANDSQDMWLVQKESVWGKVSLVVPLLGYLINFSKTKIGLVVIVLLPLLFIAISEILVIFKEVKQIRRTKRKIQRIKLNL
ncbi:MAG: signal peptidase I [Candidatus Daviesbacteria bacterium]|nr:signal peptidase I [Candidatus Daviesbacteria bacterium]